MHIGYARVSTHDQNLELQQDALQRAGCKKIIVDRVSGTVAERPGLTQVKAILREGDTLVVWRLDRLGCGLTGFVDSSPLLVIGEREILCAVYVHHVGEVEHVRQAAVSPGVRLRPGRYSHPAGHDAVTGRQDTGRSHPSGGARGYAAAVSTCVGRD